MDATQHRRRGLPCLTASAKRLPLGCRCRLPDKGKLASRPFRVVRLSSEAEHERVSSSLLIIRTAGGVRLRSMEASSDDRRSCGKEMGKEREQ